MLRAAQLLLHRTCMVRAAQLLSCFSILRSAASPLCGHILWQQCWDGLHVAIHLPRLRTNASCMGRMGIRHIIHVWYRVGESGSICTVYRYRAACRHACCECAIVPLEAERSAGGEELRVERSSETTRTSVRLRSVCLRTPHGYYQDSSCLVKTTGNTGKYELGSRRT